MKYFIYIEVRTCCFSLDNYKLDNEVVVLVSVVFVQIFIYLFISYQYALLDAFIIEQRQHLTSSPGVVYIECFKENNYKIDHEVVVRVRLCSLFLFSFITLL